MGECLARGEGTFPVNNSTRELSSAIRSEPAALDVDELVHEFEEACGVLDGLVLAAEALGWGTFTVLSDARGRAGEGLRWRAEALSSRV